MNDSTQSIADYLAQLLKDRHKVNAFPNVFLHVERLIDEEITRVRSNLFQVNGVKKEPLVLPDPQGDVVTLTEKVFVPVKDHPEFNFVGRILGPRGMTAKQLEGETGCKIMVRGKGSMRDKKKEEQNRGKPNWEHLNEELHVLISVEDTENRAKVKIQRAIEEVKKLIVPAEGEDELKKRQLMELAIINGTYRDSDSMRALAVAGQYISLDQNAGWRLSCDEEWRRMAIAAAAETQRLLSPGMSSLGSQLRAQTPLGAPLILSPRIQAGIPTTAASLLNGTSGAQQLLPPHEAHGLIYAPFTPDYANFAALTGSPILTAEYPSPDHSDCSQGGYYAAAPPPPLPQQDDKMLRKDGPPAIYVPAMPAWSLPRDGGNICLQLVY